MYAFINVSSQFLLSMYNIVKKVLGIQYQFEPRHFTNTAQIILAKAKKRIYLRDGLYNRFFFNLNIIHVVRFVKEHRCLSQK